MEKKSLIIVVIVMFLLAAIISFSKEVLIDKEMKTDNKTTTKITTTKKETVTTKPKEDIMDGITLNYQSSIRMEKNGKVIYFDPYKIDSNKNDADYIFITHSHYDHYSQEDIKKVMKDNTRFIVTNDLESKVLSLGVSSDNILVANPNETKKVDDLTFDIIPAYNINKSYHKKSYNWVGYNLTIGSVRYYVVGDSDVTDEFKSVKCDVIFVPVGGVYTMSDSEAALSVNEMNVKVAVPVHYGEVGSRSNAENFVNMLNENIEGIILK